MLYFALLISALMFVNSCGNYAPNVNTANTNANANTNSTSSPAVVEADVKKMLTDMGAAMSRNDAEALGRFLSDDYRLVSPAGDIQTKEERLSDLRSGATKFESFAYEDVNVRTYGDTAVAIARVNVKGKVRGRDAGPATATIVFAKTKDGWKVVSGQATPASAPPAGTSPTANTATRTPAAGNTNARNTSTTNTAGNANTNRANMNVNR